MKLKLWNKAKAGAWTIDLVNIDFCINKKRKYVEGIDFGIKK